jgi:hypothetical protein
VLTWNVSVLKGAILKLLLRKGLLHVQSVLEAGMALILRAEIKT